MVSSPVGVAPVVASEPRPPDAVMPEHCPACVLCRDHVGFIADRAPEEPAEDPGSLPDHDPSACGCEDGRPCPACRLASERDALSARLAVLHRAVADLIARNGYCAVCERYAPFHLVGCPMG